MPTVASKFFDDLHGKDCEFLSKAAAIDFAEQFARLFYAQKINESKDIHDSFFFEEKRGKLPPNPPIQDLP